jgi:flap endonuclease-1
MGIRGLTGWIKWATPTSLTEPTWTDFSGKTIGIDILGLLYKVKAQRACPLKYMAQFIISCKSKDITPIFIFDGKPPDAKRDALKKRNAIRIQNTESLKHLETYVAPFIETESEKAALEAKLKVLLQNTSYFTSEERDLCKQLCYAAGVLCLNATGEADDILAYLFKNGNLDAVISCDLDMLARGVRSLLVPLAWTMPGDNEGWILYNLDTILTSTQLDYEKFVEMCVLMGCDYTVSQRCLPYKSAYWATKYRGDLLKTLEVMNVRDETPYMNAIARLKGLIETPDSLMGEKQWNKLVAGAPEKETHSLLLFREGPLATLSESEFAILLN